MSLVKNPFERAVNLVDFNYLGETGAPLPKKCLNGANDELQIKRI